jgi:hypothetical protein
VQGNIITHRELIDPVKIQIFGNDSSNQSVIHEEIKNRLIWDNTCYRSLQNLSWFRLLAESVKIKIEKGNNLQMEMEKHKQKAFVNRLLTRIFGRKKTKGYEDGEY